jgi:hypothetical protein
MADDVYTPSTGLQDAATFPSKPPSGTGVGSAREQIQRLLGQILGFHNTHQAKLVSDSPGVHGLLIQEGTWTPTLAGSTTAGSHTYTSQSGTYYKIGRMIVCHFYITINVKDAAMAGDPVLLKGFPFVNLNSSVRPALVFGYTSISLGAGNILAGNLGLNSSIATLYKTSSGAAALLQVSDISNGTRIEGSLTYYTN